MGPVRFIQVQKNPNPVPRSSEPVDDAKSKSGYQSCRSNHERGCNSKHRKKSWSSVPTPVVAGTTSVARELAHQRLRLKIKSRMRKGDEAASSKKIYMSGEVLVMFLKPDRSSSIKQSRLHIDSSLSNFPSALAIGLNEVVYITLLVVSASGISIRTFNALRSQREGVRIFKNVLTVHLPLLVFVFQQESLKGQLKAAAVTLVSIIWGIESVALVTTAQWLGSEIQRDTEKKDVIELQQKPSPYLPSNPIGERHYWDFNLSEIQI
ncbi:hypothetical protein B0H13DRAFT_1855596 [Mycena leptocephala]|nr:hypothetical protein B0H13DRAFT_1855596 [Mycena leptocephala]